MLFVRITPKIHHLAKNLVHQLSKIRSSGYIQQPFAMASTSAATDGKVDKLLGMVSGILEPSLTGKPDHEYRIIEKQKLERCILEYDSLPHASDDRRKFLLFLCQNYGTNQALISKQCESLLDCINTERGKGTLLQTQHRLKKLLVPKYFGLFTQLGSLENGVKFLIDMRYDAICESKKGPSGDALMDFSEHLGDILKTWFAVGLLQLERITWKTPADILEKVGKYEAVHMVKGWMDLKHRLGPSRRCYAFFHKNMPLEPVIVLHVALTQQISSNISEILNYKSEARARSHQGEVIHDSPQCAIFYSITSTQKGLQGIELGAYLIQAVVDCLKREQHQLGQFSSLSPIPGFSKWLSAELNCGKILQFLDAPVAVSLEAEIQRKEKGMTLLQLIKDATEGESLAADHPHNSVLESALVRLCAAYICHMKRRGYALDPVANFHLKNGAVVWRINWMADKSPSGMRQSYGLMVNYRYYLDDMAPNSANYIENKTISVSKSVRGYMPPGLGQTLQSSKL